MAVIGLDDTDSRDRGMCTTYVAARIASRFRRGDPSSGRGTAAGEPIVSRPTLVRLNPAVPHKTRGNAALALHVDVPVDRAFDLARGAVEAAAETGDPNTHPGLVVAPGRPADVPMDVVAFSRTAMGEIVDLTEARSLIEANGYRSAGWKSARGLIGALAAVGALGAMQDRTYELLAYRSPDRWGTPRAVDEASVFEADAAGGADVWDSVDRVAGEAVCVPHTPGPVLYGVRGDDPGAVRAVASRIESEPVHAAALFVTNQGTDAHLRDGRIGSLRGGRAYRVAGVVAGEPETRRGGHVFVTLRAPGEAVSDPAKPEAEFARDDDTEAATIECAAFEPTKRFRDRIRALRPGDRVLACGEVSDGTLKLEKIALRDLVETERVTPTCPGCDRRMESAGAGQGYRCRDCGTSADGKVERRIDRELDRGWYEVPPVARRHIAKPLCRGGFDAPVYPER